MTKMLKPPSAATSCARCHAGKRKCEPGAAGPFPCQRCERLGYDCVPHGRGPGRPRGTRKRPAPSSSSSPSTTSDAPPAKVLAVAPSLCPSPSPPSSPSPPPDASSPTIMRPVSPTQESPSPRLVPASPQAQIHTEQHHDVGRGDRGADDEMQVARGREGLRVERRVRSISSVSDATEYEEKCGGLEESEGGALMDVVGMLEQTSATAGSGRLIRRPVGGMELIPHVTECITQAFMRIGEYGLFDRAKLKAFVARVDCWDRRIGRDSIPHIRSVVNWALRETERQEVDMLEKCTRVLALEHEMLDEDDAVLVRRLIDEEACYISVTTGGQGLAEVRTNEAMSQLFITAEELMGFSKQTGITLVYAWAKFLSPESLSDFYMFLARVYVERGVRGRLDNTLRCQTRDGNTVPCAVSLAWQRQTARQPSVLVLWLWPLRRRALRVKGVANAQELKKEVTVGPHESYSKWVWQWAQAASREHDMDDDDDALKSWSNQRMSHRGVRSADNQENCLPSVERLTKDRDVVVYADLQPPSPADLEPPDSPDLSARSSATSTPVRDSRPLPPPPASFDPWRAPPNTQTYTHNPAHTDSPNPSVASSRSEEPNQWSVHAPPSTSLPRTYAHAHAHMSGAAMQEESVVSLLAQRHTQAHTYAHAHAAEQQTLCRQTGVGITGEGYASLTAALQQQHQQQQQQPTMPYASAALSKHPQPHHCQQQQQQQPQHIDGGGGAASVTSLRAQSVSQQLRATVRDYSAGVQQGSSGHGNNTHTHPHLHPPPHQFHQQQQQQRQQAQHLQPPHVPSFAPHVHPAHRNNDTNSPSQPPHTDPPPTAATHDPAPRDNPSPPWLRTPTPPPPPTHTPSEVRVISPPTNPTSGASAPFSHAHTTTSSTHRTQMSSSAAPLTEGWARCGDVSGAAKGSGRSVGVVNGRVDVGSSGGGSGSGGGGGMLASLRRSVEATLRDGTHAHGITTTTTHPHDPTTTMTNPGRTSNNQHGRADTEEDRVMSGFGSSRRPTAVDAGGMQQQQHACGAVKGPNNAAHTRAPNGHTHANGRVSTYGMNDGGDGGLKRGGVYGHRPVEGGGGGGVCVDGGVGEGSMGGDSDDANEVLHVIEETATAEGAAGLDWGTLFDE